MFAFLPKWLLTCIVLKGFIVLLRLNQMLYALCLSYHSNTEQNMMFCLHVFRQAGCDGPAWRKTCKHNSFYVGVVWQTQSILQQLVHCVLKSFMIYNGMLKLKEDKIVVM